MAKRSTLEDGRRSPSPKPRGRTATGAIPDQEQGGRLVHEWAMDEASEEDQALAVELVFKAYGEARTVTDRKS